MATKPTSKSPKRSATRAASTTPKAAAKTFAKVTSTKAFPETGAPLGMDGTKPVSDELTKKELVERMVSESGMKKGDARRALEATMTMIAGVLREGKEMSVPPLGKIKIARSKDTPNGKLFVLRVKLKEPGAGGGAGKPKDDPLAEDAE